MKPSYSGFEAKKANNFVDLPPVGAYVAEIKKAVFVPGENGYRDKIECYLEITEGEYAGRFTEVWNDQTEKFGKASYRGIFNLIPYVDGDEDWRKRVFEGNLWCVQQSNPGYAWDWHEEKLVGKKVGINLRKRLYTYGGKDRETVEIAQFETVDDVKNGKCKILNPRDRRTKDDSTDGSEFTDVSKDVSVPWG